MYDFHNVFYFCSYSSAIKLSEDEWWVTGGSSLDGLLDKTEIYNVGMGRFEESVQLPRPMDLHSVFWLNDSTIMIIDGQPQLAGPGAW